MQLEENMYVRTQKYGIAKIIGGVNGNKFNIDVFKKDGITLRCQKAKDIIKASHNIIELIEVGDYVNGLQVIEVREHLHNDIEIILTNGSFNWSFSKNESDYKIKSIVTKEQFEQMQYKVGE